MSNSTAIASTEETARFAPARLPWHPMIEERFGAIGANKASWKALTEAVFPGAKSVDSVVMALSYCAARKLDPFKRPVHIVPMWDSQSRQMVETVWPGISEIRTTAFRTGQYAGCDEVDFGPMVERTFTGMVGKRGQEKEVTIKVTFPEWGRINVYRTLNGHRCKFVSPKVYWLESYGRQGASDVPNDMWSKRPSGQLEKCVEAAGLRKAFPEEVGNDYTAEEMHGQALLSDATPHAQIEGPAAPVPQATVTGPAAPPSPPSPATHALGKPGSDFGQSDPAGRDHPVQDAEIVEAPSPAEGGGEAVQEKPAEPEHPAHAQEEPFDVEAWLEEAQGLFHGAKTLSDVDDVHAIFEETATDLPTIERQRYEDMHGAAMQRIEDAARQAAEAQQDAENTGEADAAAAPLPVNASEAQDDDVTLEADDDEQADAAGPNRGEIYVAKIRAMIADPEITFPVVGKLWNDTKAERSEMMADGLISKETRNELLSELDARKKAEAPAQAQQDGPGAPPPPAADGPGAPPPPANDHADEDPITKLDREFRAQLEACPDKVAVAALAAETLVARNKFSGTPQHKAWSDLVAAKRKSFAGVA